MSEPIKVGDLVMVVRKADFGCCVAPGEDLGKIFVVCDLSITHFTCAICGARHGARLMAWRDKHWVFELHRLKRIPPLGELEGVDEKETLHA